MDTQPSTNPQPGDGTGANAPAKKAVSWRWEFSILLGILAVLAGLILPPIRSAQKFADITRAQATVNTLGVAFRAYFTEYGRWPTTSGSTMVMDSNTISLLTGSDVTTPPMEGNWRKKTFLEYKSTDLNRTNALVDPWRHPYYYRVDATYVNSVTNPFSSTTTLIPLGVIVWSMGPDGKSSASAGEEAGVNKDNIKSW
jgi:type II secretory pathway pseudopilin PulG